jgi:hypothetical protein
VCLAWALERFSRVETVGFDYGQRHAVELDVRPRLRDAPGSLRASWCERLGEDHVIELRRKLRAAGYEKFNASGAPGESDLNIMLGSRR